jgi:hypothetical protein
MNLYFDPDSGAMAGSPAWEISTFTKPSLFATCKTQKCTIGWQGFVQRKHFKFEKRGSRMKLIKRLSLPLCMIGLIMFLPPVANLLTLHFGVIVGRYTGIVSFALGWSLLGAGLAFSAGKYRPRASQKEIQ